MKLVKISLVLALFSVFSIACGEDDKGTKANSKKSNAESKTDKDSAAKDSNKTPPAIKWRKGYNLPNSEGGHPHHAVETKDGGFAVIGETDAGKRYTMFVLVTDKDGGVVFRKDFGAGGWSNGNHVLQEPDGNFLVAGSHDTSGTEDADSLSTQEHERVILRIDPNTLDTLLHPTLDDRVEKKVIAKGLPASPGAASGKVVFTADEAERMNNQKEDTILVRLETSPEDIHGMHAAKGILTARGGMTSHAAVVARGMGRPCVSGSSEITIDYELKQFKAGDIIIKEGDIITIDGGSGKVMKGLVPTVQPEISGYFSTIMKWADEFRKLKVRTNAETEADSKTAREFGAEGIGLCRTEHMFFDEERILSVRQMILSKSKDDRNSALDKLLPHQKEDFKKIFKVMSGLPVTVRLLDPPLHEFLPKADKDIEEVARSLNLSAREVKDRIAELHEENPMLGHRGCRLGISFPEIYEMQCRAIFEAIVELKKQKVKAAFVEIMIPLVSTESELKILRALVNKIASEIEKENKLKLEYMVGTMIELPRAALQAKSISKHADFFSFGTNDLTQTTFGISRDDSGKFLNDYIDNKIFDVDPFVSIDQNGVGELVELASSRGRKTNKNIKLGICGEHGGDPKSIEFCSRTGLNYVSCSPFRVPVARLAAAQAELSKQ